jgi:hypothetical protein
MVQPDQIIRGGTKQIAGVQPIGGFLPNPSLLNGVGYFAGTATAEGYATDATNGGLLWEAVGRRGGTTG